MKNSTPNKTKVEYRYYVIPDKERVLALLGDEWKREYGEGLSKLHFHNYLEVGICYEGFGKVVLDEDIYDFAPGSIVIIPPNIPHTTNVEPGETAFWEWMYFDVEKALDDMFLKEDPSEKKEKLKQVYSFPYLIKRDNYPVISKVLELIISELNTKRSMYRLNINCLLQIFIVEVLRMNDVEERKEVKLHEMMQIRTAIEYVHSHYNMEIKIRDLSKICNVSESHFRRVFYRCMNIRPLDYINLIRIENACELLKKTRLSMSEISDKCGFGNVTTFTRNFQKFYDMTPYQWQKALFASEQKHKDYRINSQ
ncbi:MAG: AraC family transcriptional regulator, partial [Blautia sp.]|nr:AraC family transcriptional regulator [Blautia sp.]